MVMSTRLHFEVAPFANFGLQGLSDYIGIRLNRPAKIVVWHNNTHLGDSNSTDRGTKGEVNLGRLIR